LKRALILRMSKQKPLRRGAAVRRKRRSAGHFPEAAEADGDNSDFLTVKKRDDGAPVKGGDAAEFQQKLNVYFCRSEGLGENEMFLKKFCSYRMWVDEEYKKKGHVNEKNWMGC